MTHKPGDQPRPAQLTFTGDVIADGGALSSMYRLGDDARNQETLADGKRILSWRIRSHDRQLAQLAGWSIFHMISEGDIMHLYLPESTRNAHSVLSWQEAWSGEKRAVVERASQYLGDIYSRFGIHETGFSWNQVGITPDQKIFIAPPNTPSSVPEEQVQTWQRAVVTELEVLLQGDTPNEELVDLFAQSLQKG